MDNIVMGGGMGGPGGAPAHRHRSRIAMPETGIGTVPDVGASHFLSKMPVELALYVGLTGVSLGAADTLLCGGRTSRWRARPWPTPASGSPRSAGTMARARRC